MEGRRATRVRTEWVEWSGAERSEAHKWTPETGRDGTQTPHIQYG